MKAYFTTFKLKFINSIQYRSAALASISTQFFFGFVFIMVYVAFYESGDSTTPMSLKELITYMWLNQAFFSLLFLYYKDHDLLNMIKDGNIAYELARPQTLYFKWYARILAEKIANVLLRFFPLILVTLFFPEPYNLSLPNSFICFILFLVSLIVAAFLVTGIVLFFHIIIFYTIDSKGVLGILTVIGELFAGEIIPIPFFPKFLKLIAYILPFRYIADLPFRIYSGNISVTEALPQMGIQLIWTIITILGGYFLTKNVLKKVTVQGG